MRRGFLFLMLIALVISGCGLFYKVRNPERANLDDAARSGAPGKFIRLADGFTHYELSGPDTGRAVVLVHGFSVPYYIWDSTAAALATAGYHVLRYDEYGRGWSDRPNVDFGANVYDRQLSELLDSLHMGDRIDLAGVSMGGWVTATFARRHPTRVRSLTLVDPVAGTSASSQGMFDYPMVGPLLWQMLAVPKMADGQSSDFVDPSRFPGWADRYRVQTRFRGFGRAMLATRRSTAGMMTDTLYRAVAATGVPVLLIWGEKDTTVPFERSGGVRAALPAAEFHAISGAGHLPILERAAQTDSLVLAFLARQPR